MKYSEIESIIETKYPTSLASEWDNSGFQVGYKQKDICKIFIAFEPTEKSINKAIKLGADLMITHHPLLFNPVRCISDEECIGRRIISALYNNLSIYSIHTNFDKVSMSKLCTDKLEISETICLDEEEGYGLIAILKKEINTLLFAQKLKKIFKLPDIRIFGNTDMYVKKIAILPGAGKSFVKEAITKKCDVLLTGDVDHHSGVDAVENGLTVMDCGHYGLEYLFVEEMSKYLKKNIELEKVEVITENIEFPYSVV